MFRIRRFGIVKTATVIAVLYVLIIAIFIVPVAILVAAFGGDNGSNGALALIVGGLILAVVYGLVGWVIAAIGCALYNVAAGWVGGIEVQLEAVVAPAPPPVWGPSTTPPQVNPPPVAPPPVAPPPAAPPEG